MILVTGATGNVGREVVARLAADGHPVRAAIRSAKDARGLPSVGVAHEIFDFGDPASYPRSFAGVDRLFLMRPPAIADVARFIKPVLDYAGQVGVRQIVFLSLLGAEQNRFVPHAKVEKLLLAGSTPYTLLRCGFFMQNLSTTHRQDIRDHDDIFIPAGAGKTAFIDARDIAATAVKTLTEMGHENQAYALTGGEALSYSAVAETFSAVLGRRIRYSNPSPVRFAWRMRKRGHPWGYIGVVTAIYLTTRFGLAKNISPTLARLLGRPAIRMQQFIEDHADLWQRKADRS